MLACWISGRSEGRRTRMSILGGWALRRGGLRGGAWRSGRWIVVPLDGGCWATLGGLVLVVLCAVVCMRALRDGVRDG